MERFWKKVKPRSSKGTNFKHLWGWRIVLAPNSFQVFLEPLKPLLQRKDRFGLIRKAAFILCTSDLSECVVIHQAGYAGWFTGHQATALWKLSDRYRKGFRVWSASVKSRTRIPLLLSLHFVDLEGMIFSDRIAPTHRIIPIRPNTTVLHWSEQCRTFFQNRLWNWWADWCLKTEF